MGSVIYLDNNATTPVAPEVLEAMEPWLKGGFGNPSSGYRLGRLAASAIDTARGQVAELAGCQPDEWIFTSGGTESIHTAIRSALALDPSKRHIVTSAVEHSATLRLCSQLSKEGCEITILPVDDLGQIDHTLLESAIRPDTAVVSLLWANNETGVLWPLEKIAAIVQKTNAVLHIDAVQAFGKIPLRLEGLGVHFMSFSGHKLHAPKGVGGLYINRRIAFTPLFPGTQETSRRGGTPNVASIVAFGQAAELAAAHPLKSSHRDRLESSLLAAIPGSSVNGDRAHRLPNTTNLSFEGIESEAALILLDERGVCCSAGSSCATGSGKPSHVLKAMGLTDARAKSSLRLSLSRLTTPEEITRASEILPAVIQKLRAVSLADSPVAFS
ncbi:MAG: cysteine desulfurase family protein [Terrimicrobiaceae bacterium]